MKRVAIGEFKARCLALLEQVRSKKERLLITKHGRPIAEVCPLKNQNPDNDSLLGSVILEKDIVSPVDVAWQSLK